MIKILARALVNSWRITLVSSTSLLLLSCATTPKTTGLSLEVQQAKLSAITTINIKSRAIIKRDGSIYHFNLNLKQQQDTFNIQGFDFLGRQMFNIDGDKKLANLKSDNKDIVLSSKSVIYNELGLNFEPKILFNIIKGIIVKDFLYTEENNLLKYQKNSAVKVTYKKYSLENKLYLPSVINIEADNLTIKIAIFSWEYGTLPKLLSSK